ncbi:MAG: alpha-amylase family glycosyl hydrolase [Blautia faecis]
MGGDLSGILKNLEYTNSLGVECLYLNPIFKGFNHKYATTDYLEIDPSFGTKETFQELVETCHKYGIKIVLDGVFNHWWHTFRSLFGTVLEKSGIIQVL